MLDKTAKRYLADVKSALKNTKNYRKNVLQNLEADIQEFLGENRDATEADLLAYFGNPGDYAAEYAATLSSGEWNAGVSAGKRVVTAVVAGILAALLIWSIGVGIAVHNDNAISNGYHQIGTN